LKTKQRKRNINCAYVTGTQRKERKKKRKKKKKKKKKWRKISTNASACLYLIHHYMASGTKLTLTTDIQNRKH